jgi:hypothetical protein
MKSKEVVIGFCKLCGEKKKLTFEHIPPRVAFNKTTRYFSIPSDEYYITDNLLKLKPKGNIIQGGVGSYCLCKDCNSFLGQNYVRSYVDFVNIGMNLLYKYEFNTVLFKAKNQNPLRVLKQVASMFISISEPTFKETCPEIFDFVRKPEKIDLPEKYRFFMYLNNEGNYRKFGFPTITNQHGAICELAYPPFGFVLNIDIGLALSTKSKNGFRQLTEITHFNNFTDSRDNEFEILLNKLPTHIQIPLDFRNINEMPTD